MLTLRAETDEFGTVHVDVVDLDAFVHANPDEHVCVYTTEGEPEQTFVCKSELRELEIVGEES